MIPFPRPAAALGIHNTMLTETNWRLMLAGLSGAVLLFTIYCLSNGITTIFMHLYYFPIVLLSYHYRRTGVILSALLGLLYVSLVAFYIYPPMQELYGAFVRFVLFLAISAVVAYLSSALKRQQRSSQSLFDSTGEGILYVTQEDLIITDLNPHCIHLLEYEPGELIGKPFGTICTDHEGNAITPETFTLTSPDENREVRIMTKTGSEKVAILTAGIFPDKRYVLTLTDITGQIQLKNEIQQLNVLQENIITNANVWLMLLDARGRVLIWNLAAEDITGYPAEEVIGHNAIWKKLYPDPDYRLTITKEIDDIIQTDSYLRDFETKIIAQNGERKVILWNTRELPLATADGGKSYVAIGVDVTSRVKAENTLHKRELELKEVFNQSFQLITLLETDGTVLKINQTAQDFGGVTEADVVGKNFWETIWWSHSTGVQEQVRDAVRKAANSEYVYFESTNKRADGSIRTITFSTHPVKDETGRVVFLICEGRDITERIKGEELLRTANKKLNLLSSITRHDIINQITAALAFVSLLKMEDVIPEGTDAEKEVQQISEALETIKRQIIFTRDYQDLGVHSPEWFNVGAIVAATISGAFDTLKVVNEVINLELYSDPLFEKVIYTLFDNAVRHGKTITTIRFTSEETPDGLKLICEDDGVGVPADVKEKIFKRQYYQNTGLGLFLSQEILSITGMTIKETGVPGEGARFEILVPEGMWRTTNPG